MAKNDLNFIGIPTKGVKFRLKARDSKYVIYSCPENDPLVRHYLGPEYNDQIFTLIYGKGERSGLYAIKSWYCGKVLYSRLNQPSSISNIYGDGDYNDNWFRFAQDENDKESFRIYCPASNTVLYSCTAQDPMFSNYDGPKYNDQLFRFVLV